MKSAQLVIVCFWPNAHWTLHPHLRSPQTEYIAYKVAVYWVTACTAAHWYSQWYSSPTAGTIQPYAHNKRKYIFIIYRFVDAIFHVVYGTVHRVAHIPIGRINHNDCIVVCGGRSLLPTTTRHYTFLRFIVELLRVVIRCSRCQWFILDLPQFRFL